MKKHQECFSAANLQHSHTTKLFPLLPNPWVDLLANWLPCEGPVYTKGWGPKCYRTQLLIPVTALSALGLHVFTVCGCVHTCVFSIFR